MKRDKRAPGIDGSSLAKDGVTGTLGRRLRSHCMRRPRTKECLLHQTSQLRRRARPRHKSINSIKIFMAGGRPHEK